MSRILHKTMEREHSGGREEGGEAVGFGKDKEGVPKELTAFFPVFFFFFLNRH